MPSVQCEQCGKAFHVIPARVATARFCSLVCRGDWRKVHFRGENNPKWQGGSREKVCAHCGVTFTMKPTDTYGSWKRRKFCSKPCADKGGFRYSGEGHPGWKPSSRRKSERGKHGAWARAVISRDRATCQHCGATGVELHAHHVKPFAEYPALRWEVSNGITLCHRCHWDVHTASAANGVNSGDTLPGNAGGNPEPSFGRKPVEGVTTRGRAYRRWEGSCAWCGVFISKRWSDATGKKNLFCSYRCSTTHTARNRKPRAMAVISSTSAPRESDDIV